MVDEGAGAGLDGAAGGADCLGVVGPAHDVRQGGRSVRGGGRGC